MAVFILNGNIAMEVEEIIADTINGNPIKIKFRDKDIEIPRPTLGTLIEVSKHIAKLPEFAIIDDPKDPRAYVTQTLSLAKDSGKIAEILAIMMLGKKNMRREVRIFGITVRKVDRVKALAAEIEDMTSKEIADLMTAIFSSMDCAFFLGVITSLNAINITKPTTTETTALGQQ